MRNRFGIQSSLAARAVRFGLRERPVALASTALAPTTLASTARTSTALATTLAASALTTTARAASAPASSRGRIQVSKRGLQVGVRVQPIAPARDPGSEQP